MSDRTYMQLCKNDVSTIQLNIWKQTTGETFIPSGAYFTVKGADKNNTVIPRTLARNYNNEVWATITQVVTVSAAEYDVCWELYRHDAGITNHCTRILVVDEC